jgi:DNA end-binding protein Ku
MARPSHGLIFALARVTADGVAIPAAKPRMKQKARVSRGEDADVHEMPKKTATKKQPAKKTAAKKTATKTAGRKPRSA